MICPVVFKSYACGYKGMETECDKTSKRCRELDNFANFRGDNFVDDQCNCPSKNMIVHVVGCPKRHIDNVAIDVKTLRVTVTGRPLSDMGLDGAHVVHPDGTSHPLIGIFFHRWDNDISLYDNLRKAFGEQYPGCSLVFGPL